VLFINLDRFKYINDLFGYEYGDAFLQQSAKRIVETVPASATAGRFAGDEFAVLLPDASEELAVEYANRLISVLSQPAEIMGQELALTASIGISRAEKMQEDLIKNAEAAMLYSKKYNKSSYSLYSHESNKETADRLTIERELKSAVSNNEFQLHYQPIIDLKSGELAAMEALIRWNHPELGMVAPD